MKKFLAVILAFIIFALCLGGCTKKPDDTVSSSEITQNTTSTQTGAENSQGSASSNINAPSQSGTQTSDGTSNTQDPSNTQSGEPSLNTPGTSQGEQVQNTPSNSTATSTPVSFTLNYEYLNMVGSTTYSELKQKYGEPTDVFYDELKSAVYKFPGTEVWYGFNDLDWGKKLDDPTVWPEVPTDKNGKWIFSKAPKPTQNAKCNAIYYLKVSDLITNLTQPTDIADFDMYSQMQLLGGNHDGKNNSAFYLIDDKYVDIECSPELLVDPQGTILKIKLYSDIS